MLSLRGDTLDSRDLPIAGAPTLGLGTDERGLDRLSIVRREVNGDPWLWIPFPGWAVAVSPDGAPLARLQVGIRANYLIPPPGPRLFESGIQTYLDSPRLEFGDVDGDGRTDVIASARYELRVFLQREDGSFGESPDRVQPLRRISESDHLRGSGAVRVQIADANGDDRADVIVSYLSGGLTDIRTRTTLHLNRGGGFDLDVADHAFETDDSWVSDWLIDTDGDARPEWVRAKVSLSLFELIEVLLTRSLDAELEVYRQDSESGFEREPFERRELSLPYSFDTYRPRGFIPTLEEDLNGDGQLDLLASGAGGKLEVFLGGPTRRLRRRDATQELDTRGRIRFGDLNGDSLPDFLIFDPRRPDASLRIARNTGSLASGGVPSTD